MSDQFVHTECEECGGCECPPGEPRNQLFRYKGLEFDYIDGDAIEMIPSHRFYGMSKSGPVRAIFGRLNKDGMSGPFYVEYSVNGEDRIPHVFDESDEAWAFLRLLQGFEGLDKPQL